MTIDLLQIQRELQHSIMAGVHEAQPADGTDVRDRAQRVGIYASAYRSRLHDALAHNFPMLLTYLGDVAFAAVAGSYIDAHPSAYASIRAFGDRLSHWLAATRSSEPWLAEFASFEWQLGCAFDAPDDTALSMDALASVAPAQWASLRFEFARAVQRLDVSTNAPELYAEAARGERLHEGRIESHATDWLVWRQDLTARYRSMTSLEALAFDTLAGGATFGDACARLLEQSDDEDEVPLQAAACLKRWIADELIVTFSLEEDDDGQA